MTLLVGLYIVRKLRLPTSVRRITALLAGLHRIRQLFLQCTLSLRAARTVQHTWKCPIVLNIRPRTETPCIVLILRSMWV